MNSNVSSAALQLRRLCGALYAFEMGNNGLFVFEQRNDPKMKFEEIEKLVRQSLSDLYEHDLILLKHDVCERAITHRLAIYVERRISELDDIETCRLDVDCEYNRNVVGRLGAPKSLIIEAEDEHEKANKFGCQSEEVLEVSSYPDIIVHRRGDNDHNLLVIEVKKKSSRIADTHDIKKIKAFTKKDELNEYGYSYGVFVKLDTRSPVSNQPVCDWYIEGQQQRS